MKRAHESSQKDKCMRIFQQLIPHFKFSQKPDVKDIQDFIMNATDLGPLKAAAQQFLSAQNNTCEQYIKEFLKSLRVKILTTQLEKNTIQSLKFVRATDLNENITKALMKNESVTELSLQGFDNAYRFSAKDKAIRLAFYKNLLSVVNKRRNFEKLTLIDIVNNSNELNSIIFSKQLFALLKHNVYLKSLTISEEAFSYSHPTVNKFFSEYLNQNLYLTELSLSFALYEVFINVTKDIPTCKSLKSLTLEFSIPNYDFYETVYYNKKTWDQMLITFKKFMNTPMPPQLKEFKLSTHKVELVDILFNSYENMQQLESIACYHTPFFQSNEIVAKQINEYKNLTKLELSEIETNQHQFTMLMNSLKTMHTLTTLILNENQYNEDSNNDVYIPVAELLESPTTQLKELVINQANLRENRNFTTDRWIPLLRALTQNTTLISATFDNENAHDISITPEFIESLCEMIERNTTLQKLILKITKYSHLKEAEERDEEDDEEFNNEVYTPQEYHDDLLRTAQLFKTHNQTIIEFNYGYIGENTLLTNLCNIINDSQRVALPQESRIMHSFLQKFPDELHPQILNFKRRCVNTDAQIFAFKVEKLFN